MMLEGGAPGYSRGVARAQGGTPLCLRHQESRHASNSPPQKKILAALSESLQGIGKFSVQRTQLPAEMLVLIDPHLLPRSRLERLVGFDTAAFAAFAAFSTDSGSGSGV